MKINKKPVIQRTYDSGIADAIQSAGIHPVLARIYASRGLTASDISPGINTLPPKESLEGCMEAGAMIAEAIVGGRKIICVGDYDADGAGSTACMMRGIGSLGGDIDFIIPDRVKDGYGISPAISQRVKNRGGELIVTVDNGIAAHAGIAEAKRLGMDVIVTDHHLQAESLPNADCIVNPNVRGSKFASRALAGVGVAFYVLGALREQLRARQWHKDFHLASLLDIVAMSTVGDLVPLDQCNRTLVNMGLDRIRARKGTPGIQALLSVSGKNPMTVNSETAGFALAPRINAAGRLETADIGIRLLTTDNLAEAIKIAYTLDNINSERKQLQMDMTDAALSMIEDIDVDGRKSLVVFDKSFHEGIVGLVASKLKEAYHRPSGAFAVADDGNLKGSFRSIPGVHIRDAIVLVSQLEPGLVLKQGGHAMAAGAMIKAGGLKRFAKLFESAVEQLAGPDAFNPSLEADGEIGIHDMTMDLAEQIRSQNWGQAFAAPTFTGHFNVRGQRPVGTGHLKLNLEQGGSMVEAIFFGRDTPVDDEIEALFRLDVNEYNGAKRVQLIVEGVAD